MPTFNVLKQFKPSDTFRARAVLDQYTIADENLSEQFNGNIDTSGKEWNIGLIVGGSGSGKSTIARECFGELIVDDMEYSGASVVDDMPDSAGIKEITHTFTSVGFASPPSWLKPYAVLSNGEKMRVDLARAILEKGDCFAFDEFTSVVDRRVAKTGSAAVAKAVRKRGGQFIAITCHHDVTEWLEPDWIYDTDKKQFFFAGANGRGRKLGSTFSRLVENQDIKSGTCLQSITI